MSINIKLLDRLREKKIIRDYDLDEDVGEIIITFSDGTEVLIGTYMNALHIIDYNLYLSGN